MAIDLMKKHGFGTAIVVSLACMGLAAGCSSAGKTATPSGGAGGVPGSGGSAQSAAPAASTAAAAGGGSVNATCPTAAQVSAALGATFPAPKVNGSGGSIVCAYTNAAGGNVAIDFAAFPGGTASTLKIAIDSQAQAQGVSDVAVPGYGDAAYMFTMHDASTNSSGVATTLMSVLVGSENFAISAEATPTQVEAIARDILGN